MDDERVLVLTPGDEATEKIARAFASRTAGQIMKDLAAGPKSASEIADSLSLPITTVMYHLDKLEEAGILEVAATRWSEKGRQVKLYRQAERVVIVAPPYHDIRSLLARYGILFCLVAAAAIVMLAVSPFFTTAETPVAVTAYRAGVRAAGIPEYPLAGLVHEVILPFVAGGCMVIIAMMICDLWQWRRNR
ncbi:MAG: ArsR/SmtB family transcription factor [Methanoculleaceae archaeon]